jgi:uncharacterized protein
VEIVVMADTHLPGELQLPRPLHRAVERADIVLHAGDITSGLALRQLCGLADVWAVVGNNDHELVGALPVTLSILLDQVRVAVVHDSGPTRGRAGRLSRRFPEADVVVFGHSHVPVAERGLEDQLLFNPGSPTQRRQQPARTFGRLRIEGQRVTAHSIEVLDD